VAAAPAELIIGGSAFARSIDGRIAHQDLQASRTAPGYIESGITLSNGEAQGERAPTRLIEIEADVAGLA
jgi:hypothetical protein